MAERELRLGVAGAAGRMGEAVIRLARGRPDMKLVAAVGRPGGIPTEGAPAMEADAALAACEVIVDFSTPAAAVSLAEAAAARGGTALVIGVTGFSAEQEATLASAANRIGIVKSNNFYLAVTLLAALVETAARRLTAENWDVEIVEAHHRGKHDAPSGTALMLGEAAARGRGQTLSVAEAGSPESGPRSAGGVGFASVRGGGIVGEHAVLFAGDDEILTLSHSARDRRLFARGALEAALWVRGRPPGLYDMRDVLDLRAV